jgi:type VI secretion system protein ImpI
MYLTFEVVSANAATLGDARRKVFSVDGGRIGRAPECDMVLSGLGVHRHHATVRFINGVFFIEGVGTNGIAVNNPDIVIPRNEPYPIKTGDKVFIDEFEIAVTASAARPAEPTASRPAVREVPGVPDVRQPPIPLESADNLDPMRILSAPTGGGVSRATRQPDRQVIEPGWNHTPSLADHFTPPPPAVPSSGGMAIPEDWDKTSFNRSKLQPVVPQAPPPAPRPTPPAPAASPPQAARPAAPVRATPATPRASSPSGGAFDWEGFLRAAGVDPATVPPETAAIMGNIMRSVVQGLIEVLRARSEIKTEFRMPVTQVKVSENNPLKFAANAEDAISSLLGRRNSAYLGPKEAFEDAFNDVRFHQLAMLVGVRAGFDSLMSRFDPAQLQELFERQGKRGGLFGGGKARYWELYTERFQELSADGDETFRRLFGEEFARAYEKQLSVLKRERGGS